MRVVKIVICHSKNLKYRKLLRKVLKLGESFVMTGVKSDDNIKNGLAKMRYENVKWIEVA